MSHSHRDLPGSPPSDPPLLGPALSPGTADSADSARRHLDDLLGPFSGAPRDADLVGRWDAPPTDHAPEEPEAAEVTHAEAAPEADGGDLPWLEADPTLWTDAPSAAPVDLDTAGEGALEVPTFLQDVEETVTEDDAAWVEFPAGPAALALPAVIAEADPSISDELLAPPEWEYGFEASASADGDVDVASAPPAPEILPLAESDASHPAVLEEIARRLEDIAQSLRERAVADLLGNADDPLQVLIAGYALGLAEARRSARATTDDQP